MRGVVPGRSSSVFLSLLAAALPAQELRHEVGRRVRAFERIFAPQLDAATRQRVCPYLEQAVTAFFTGQLGEVGRRLDLASRAVTAEPPAVTAADTLMLALGSRLLDVARPVLDVELKPLYRVDGALPEGLQLRVDVRRADGRALGAAMAEVSGVPWHASLQLAGLEEGDHWLVAELVAGGRRLARHEHGLSLARAPAARVAALEAALPERLETTEAATLHGLVRSLRALARNRTLETDFPAARLLAEAEGLVRAVARGERFHGKERAGQFWLTLATRAGLVAARLLVPQDAARAERLPLVVALHGAGGSENLFFDAYGAGAIVDLCERRGFVLVAPRLAGFGVDVAAIVDAIGDRFPVDAARVFLVGHSMGAAQAVAALGAEPRRWAAVAALGGGGSLPRGAALGGARCFVGCGDRDFARRGAAALGRALAAAGATVETHDYRDVEHLGIVQVALPDVFAFFDAVAGKR